MLSSTTKVKNIAILGAGIIGLSTADRLLELKLNANITIISDKFLNDTTSDGAGGLFRPDDRFIPGVPKPLVRKWAEDSFKYFDRLLFSPEGGLAGVFQASGYQMFDDVRQDPSYKEYIYQFRHLTESELNTFPRKFKYGYFSTTIGVEPRIYMKYLTDRLVKNGVKFESRKIGQQKKFLLENAGIYDVVFNCLGFGAIEFCDDKLMVPIRGQMIRITAPWIKHFYYTDDNCYIIPNVNTICLGGTRQKANFSLELDPTDTKGILDRCKELCPSLENAKIEWEWVGLRPHREPIRLEKEVSFDERGNKIIVDFKNVKPFGEKIDTKIIHNYGHGGNGIALSRGTVMHAVDLLLAESSNNNDDSSDGGGTSKLKSKL